MEWKKIRHLFLFLTLTFQFSLSSHASLNFNPYTPDETVPGFERVFEKRGIGKTYSKEGKKNLVKFLEEELKEVNRALENEDFKKRSKRFLKRMKRFLQFSLDSLRKGDGKTGLYGNQNFLFQLGKSIIYMVRAEEASDALAEQQRGNLNVDLEMALKIVGRIVKRKKIFYVKIPDLHQPLGLEAAMRESQFLAHPQRPHEILKPKDLARMTPLEAGELDVPENHPYWHTQAYMEDHPDIWEENEDWINREFTKFLNQEHKIKEEFPNFSYDLRKSQKVLFYEELRISGTSAKINAEDAFGVRWKVKWADEIHSEVMANHLYLAVGGRFVDPVYAQPPGHAGTTLILQDPKKKPKDKEKDKDKDEECYPITPEEFLSCVRNSKYQFNLRPFVVTSGKIDKDNQSEVLKYLPKEALKKFRREKLLGRHFVTFNEVQLEFSPQDVIVRGGPVSLTRFGAGEDRGQRALLLFNSWINNNDPREENTKGYFFKDRFIMAQHDMGKSFNGIIGSGNPNKFKPHGFIFSSGNYINFNFVVYYLPGAWRKATYPDLLWMARRIVQVRTPELVHIVAQTHWPDFMQEAMVYKILARRNKIAEIFGLEGFLDKGEAEATAPSLSIPLYSARLREQAAFRYQIPLDKLEEAYHAVERDAGYADNVLVNGRVSRCESSPIIRLLHLYRTPTGLDRRLTRFRLVNKLPLFPKCGRIPKVDFFLN